MVEVGDAGMRGLRPEMRRWREIGINDYAW